MATKPKANPNRGSKSNVGGRPVILTQELQDKIMALLTRWIPIELACGSLGISDYAYYSWKKKGEADIESGKDTIYSNFARAIKEVLVANVDEALDHIRSEEQWTAKAWLLERRMRNFFGKDMFEIEVREKLEKLEKIAQNQGAK